MRRDVAPPLRGRPRAARGERVGTGESRARGPTLALLAALLSLGCADTVNPVLGGLKIGGAVNPFHMPVLENEKLPFDYPRDAWRAGIGGEAVVRIHITKKGAVDSVILVKSAGHSSLDSAAVAGARRLRYRPARQGNEPVAVWGTLPIRYPMPEEARPQ